MRPLARSRIGGIPAAVRELEDEALIAALANRVDFALDELVERLGSRVRGYVYRIVRDVGWSDDVTQEVFVRAYENAKSFDPQWSAAVWLLSIARNLSIDLLRREGVRADRDETVAVDAFASPAIASAEARELQRALDRALSSIPESFRSVFVLREQQGLAYEEIAQVLGISVKTVSSRLHRCRVELKKRLEGFLE